MPFFCSRCILAGTQVVYRCRQPEPGQYGAPVAAPAAYDWERPAASGTEPQPEASTSASGSYREADVSPRTRWGARDTGIQLAAAETEEYSPDREDMRYAMQKYLPEGEKRRLLGAPA